MQTHNVTLRDGISATLYQAESGLWVCPICGCSELSTFDKGATSFEMCNCGFEFGFDDDPGASSDAVECVQDNWQRWRTQFLARFLGRPQAMAEVSLRLRAIGVEVDQYNCGIGQDESVLWLKKVHG